MAGFRRRMLVALLGLGVLTSIGLTTGALAVEPTSPSPYNRHELNGVDFSAPDDGWAVGDWSGKDDGGGDRTIARHWDGATWRTVPTVDPGGHRNRLYSVAARSTDDAWAVGYSVATMDDPIRPLIEHWDGAAWTQSPAPETEGYLHDVVALGPNNVWAVGSGAVGHPYASLILHWDGTSWSDVPHPQPGNNGLMGITAVSPRDIWAVGYAYQPLVEHWNGHIWKQVVLDHGPGGSTLSSVSAVAADDIWAVGRISPSFTQSEVLIYHWDGSEWSQVDAPAGSGDRNFLLGVTALASDDVWAVGSKGSVTPDTSKTLILHWDGARWHGVKSPNRTRADIDGHTNELDDVAAVSDSDVWAVGNFTHFNQRGPRLKTKEIIDHWDGTSWTNFLVNKAPLGG